MPLPLNRPGSQPTLSALSNVPISPSYLKSGTIYWGWKQFWKGDSYGTPSMPPYAPLVIPRVARFIYDTASQDEMDAQTADCRGDTGGGGCSGSTCSYSPIQESSGILYCPGTFPITINANPFSYGFTPYVSVPLGQSTGMVITVWTDNTLTTQLYNGPLEGAVPAYINRAYGHGWLWGLTCKDPTSGQIISSYQTQPMGGVFWYDVSYQSTTQQSGKSCNRSFTAVDVNLLPAGPGSASDYPPGPKDGPAYSCIPAADDPCDPGGDDGGGGGGGGPGCGDGH